MVQKLQRVLLTRVARLMAEVTINPNDILVSVPANSIQSRHCTGSYFAEELSLHH